MKYNSFSTQFTSPRSEPKYPHTGRFPFKLFLGGGFKHLFTFIPTWGNDPIWRAYVSNGLVQPPTSFGRAYFCSSSFVFLEGRGVNHWIKGCLYRYLSSKNVKVATRDPQTHVMFHVILQSGPQKPVVHGVMSSYGLEINVFAWGETVDGRYPACTTWDV